MPIKTDVIEIGSDVGYKGGAKGHPVKGDFFLRQIGLLRSGYGNPVKGRSRLITQQAGFFHDEGGQVVVLRGEFFGEYQVKIGSQQMFDDGEELACYSGVAGDADRCSPYARQRRLSFVTPMGLPLGTVLAVASPLQANTDPIRASLVIVRRPLYGRLPHDSQFIPR